VEKLFVKFGKPMSRFGTQPVVLPEGVTAKIGDSLVSIVGAKTTLSQKVLPEILVEEKDGALVVTKRNETRASAAQQGTMKAHLANMVKGVTEGWKKELEISGPGYRAEIKGRDLSLQVGFSHPVVIVAPEGITFTVEKSVIRVEGANRELVGFYAAKIRDVRRPSVYTGSGIRYSNEIVRKKAGKQAAKAGE